MVWWITAQSNTTSKEESMNHRQDLCGDVRSNDEVKDEPVLTASHDVPKLAAAIRERGI